MPESAASARAPHDDELRSRIREELEAEHHQRLEAFENRRAQARDQARTRRNQRALSQLEAVKEEERRRFYQEKGYREYVDSNGRSQWLPAEEYDWRMNRRKKRDRGGREYRPELLRRRRELVIYAVAAAVALLVGLLLVR